MNAPQQSMAGEWAVFLLIWLPLGVVLLCIFAIFPIIGQPLHFQIDGVDHTLLIGKH